MDRCIFGADIGGTAVKLGLFSMADGPSDGSTAAGSSPKIGLIEKWSIPTSTDDDGGSILPDVADSVRSKMSERCIDRADILGIGLDAPGPVDRDGTIHGCVNLGWGVFNLQKRMEELSGLPCRAGNDAKVATLGEMTSGAARGHRNVAMLVLGTGVGAGIIADGSIVYGANGSAGEIGHMPVREGEPEACGCGKHGCLEQYVSARGFAHQVRKTLDACASGEVDSAARAIEAAPAAGGEGVFGGEGVTEAAGASPLRGIADISSKDIFDAAKAGDAFALSMVDGLGRMLGRACADVSCVVDPEVFVIGGGLSEAGPILTDAISRHYRNYAFHTSRETPFVLAELGNDAGIYGCAALMAGA